MENNNQVSHDKNKADEKLPQCHIFPLTDDKKTNMTVKEKRTPTQDKTCGGHILQSGGQIKLSGGHIKLSGGSIEVFVYN